MDTFGFLHPDVFTARFHVAIVGLELTKVNPNIDNTATITSQVDASQVDRRPTGNDNTERHARIPWHEKL